MGGRKTRGGSRLARAVKSRYWRERDARVVLDAWLASGTSLGAFASEHGLHLGRLERWRRRLHPERQAEVAPVFFPVEVVDAAVDQVGAWRIVLGRDVRLEVPCAGGAPLLAETLTAIRDAWPC
jgi:hypothetical protein